MLILGAAAWAQDPGATPAGDINSRTSVAAPADRSAPKNPPAPSPQKPFDHFFKRWVSLQAVEATVPAAVLQQVHDWPEEWGKRRSGFEKRIGSLYGQFVVGVMIEDGVKAIHPEDTTYHRLADGNFFKRMGHVVAGTFTARNPEGDRIPAWSVPANAYGSWAIATLWSPRELRNARSIFGWGTAGLGAFAGTDFVKEFWPDIRGIFHKKK